MGSYWLSFQKTPEISKEFWHFRVRIDRITSEHPQFYAAAMLQIFSSFKVIEYMIKSKTESPTTRLKTLLLKLSEYTIDLKYQKGSEMHTSDALSRLHNFTDTPDQEDVIPLNFLQHFTPHYIEHLYSHLVDNLYTHKTKTLDAITVKRKCSRPPKPKPQIPSSKPRTPTAAKNLTT